MARARSILAPLALAFAAAALCLLGGSRAPSPRAFLSAAGAGTPPEIEEPRPQASAAWAGAAAPLLLAEPAFAENLSPPGWPYLLVFLTVFAAVFVIPNTIFKGQER
uniref:Photosystem II reaction center protein T n=1 Tax=Zooxanthella nutricula TaxID=1333877 RepID=A0A7S2NC01_9DINO